MPYLLVALVAAIAARIVYRLGTELTHARELGSYRLVERLGQGAAWAKSGARSINCSRVRRQSS